MATAKKVYPYAIYYRDGSYMIYDLTNDDFAAILKVLKQPKISFNQMGNSQPNFVIETSVGIFDMADVRSVIKQKPPEKPKPVFAAHPNLTMEDIEWLAQNKESWTSDDEDEEGGYSQ